MRIAIIGAGNVGRALGGRWSAAGHEVTYGVRQPDAANPGEASIRNAAGAAEVVVLATPWSAVENAIRACGDLTGKVLIDCTNPLLPGLAGLELGTETSGAEKVTALASGAKVVKAFNTVGYNVMTDPRFLGESASMLYCGDDSGANVIAHELALACGFEPLDAGPLTQARLLEPFALLWISLAMQHGYGREIAFRLMRR